MAAFSPINRLESPGAAASTVKDKVTYTKGQLPDGAMTTRTVTKAAPIAETKATPKALPENKRNSSSPTSAAAAMDGNPKAAAAMDGNPKGTPTAAPKVETPTAEPAANSGSGSASSYSSGGGGYVAPAKVSPYYAQGGQGNITLPELIELNGLGPDMSAEDFEKFQSDPSTYLRDYYNGYNDLFNQQTADLNSRWADIEDQYEAANAAATAQAIAQLQHQYDSAIGDYDTQRELAAYNKAVNTDNVALMNAANGNKGGIGEKQYSETMAAYDEALRQINLEQLALKNEIDYQVTQAQLSGDQALAEQLASIGQAKLDQLSDRYNQLNNNMIDMSGELDSLDLSNREMDFEAYLRDIQNRQWVADYNLSKAQQENANTQWLNEYNFDRASMEQQLLEYNREKALQDLQLGIYSDADAEALGLSPDQMKQMAGYYATSNYGGGSGSSRGSGGGGGTKTPAAGAVDVKDMDEQTLFATLAENGLATQYDAQQALINAGFTKTDAKAIADTYYNTYLGNVKSAASKAADAVKDAMDNLVIGVPNTKYSGNTGSGGAIVNKQTTGVNGVTSYGVGGTNYTAAGLRNAVNNGSVLELPYPDLLTGKMNYAYVPNNSYTQ